MEVLPSMHILTEFKWAGEEIKMMCQGLLARHAQSAGVAMGAEQ